MALTLYSFADGELVDVQRINANFARIAHKLGQLGDEDIAADAKISASKLGTTRESVTLQLSADSWSTGTGTVVVENVPGTSAITDSANAGLTGIGALAGTGDGGGSGDGLVSRFSEFFS